MPFKCIDVTSAHLDDVASIHAASYPVDHISGSMGRDLIVKYYSEFLTDENSFFGCVREGVGTDLIGFVVFGKGLPVRIHKFKRENRLKIIKFFLSRPAVSLRFILKRLSAIIQKSDRFDEAENLILSIAVSGDSAGAGSFLMGAVDSYCNSNGVDKLGLYVACSNVRALNFYYKVGFKARAFVSGQYYMEKNFEVSQ
ncbi:GNAT family N-acetyltransferase [Thalassolituus sp. UBA2009]|uniref:GNAT family N-acetyltransferase n=1 Tax=Thalassolituus sp. UBA2009 TaxID=1947658 RepID=UPI00257EA3AD|nr:GNAT family N-acetyltransferase [Thalassolituus sp. UBA2009]|tara:strand:- start:1055 stop:1648 length:594 start_codon:yes stop_codon:yes gene_type:complete